MNARVNREKTHCVRGHPLSGDNLYLSMSRGRPMRQCRQCRVVRRPKMIAGLDAQTLSRLFDTIRNSSQTFGGDATMAEVAGRFGIGVNTVARLAKIARLTS